MWRSGSLGGLLAALALVLGLGWSGGAAAEPPAGLRLLMLEETGCPWCRRWHAEIGEAYALTPEGRRAPLLLGNLHAPLPDGVRLSRPARYSPTFVVIEDGAEIGRIEGYPGADFFFGLLNQVLDRAVGQKNGRILNHAS